MILSKQNSRHKNNLMLPEPERWLEKSQSWRLPSKYLICSKSARVHTLPGSFAHLLSVFLKLLKIQEANFKFSKFCYRINVANKILSL